MDNHDVLELMKHAADTAILPRWRALADGEVREKTPGDLVTVADTDAEKVITAELHAAFPDAVLLGEEASAADPGLIERFYTADHAFTIDPIDGTANFVNGSQDFAVMVAELIAGEVVRSWIWQPGHGVAFTAEKGAGSYRNSTRMTTRQVTEDLAAWRGVTNRKALKKEKFKPLSRLHSAWWCCGVDYPNIAMGRADFIVYKHVLPWDHAPGSLLLSELNGQSIRKDGKAYAPGDPVRKWLVSGTGDVPRRVLPYLANSLSGAGTPAHPGGAEPGDAEPEDILER